MNRTTLLIVRRRIRIKRRASACGATAVEEASRLRARVPRLARGAADLAGASGPARQPRQDVCQRDRARRAEPEPRKPSPAGRRSGRVLLRDRRASRDLPSVDRHPSAISLIHDRAYPYRSDRRVHTDNSSPKVQVRLSGVVHHCRLGPTRLAPCCVVLRSHVTASPRVMKICRRDREPPEVGAVCVCVGECLLVWGDMATAVGGSDVPAVTKQLPAFAR
jgi:hypothetical protein